MALPGINTQGSVGVLEYWSIGVLSLKAKKKWFELL